MIWIKLRDKLPICSEREVRYAYLRADGSIKDYDAITSGWVLNRLAALYGTAPATTELSETVWQYHDIATSH